MAAQVIPIGANVMGYTSYSLVNVSDYSVTPLNQRTMRFTLVGATYQGQAGEPPLFVGPGGATGLLYLRDTLGNLTLGYSGNPTDVLITTGDANGNSVTEFNIEKGVQYNFVLLYTSSPGFFYYVDPPNSDHTLALPIDLPFFPILPGGWFDVGGQIVGTTGATGAVLTLTGANYEGYPGGMTGSILVYDSGLNNLGPSGPTASVNGTLIGTLRYNQPNVATGNITYNLPFDQAAVRFYMIYQMDADPTRVSGNYVTVTNINLPFDVNFSFKTTPTGVNLTMYNPIYNYTIVGAGKRLKITDFQANTSQNLLLQSNSQGIPFTTWTFGMTGGTAQVMPGSKVQFYSTAFGAPSSAYVPVPAHKLEPERINGILSSTGLIGGVPIFSNNKITMSLQNFNYFDADGNSIFNTINTASETGIINLVSSYGTTGSVYSGRTGIPVSGRGITYSGPSAYNIEFPDPVPFGPTGLKYTLSFKGDTTRRPVTKELTYNWPGLQPIPEELILNNLKSAGGSSNVVLYFSSFDYLDSFGNSIFSVGPSVNTPASGIINVYSGPFTGSSGVLVGSLAYNPGLTGPFSLNTNFVVPYNSSAPLLIQFYDNALGGLRSASQVLTISFSSETMQIAILKISPQNRNITVGSLNYLDGNNQSLIYDLIGPSGASGLAGGSGASGSTGTTGPIGSTDRIYGATGYLQLIDPSGNLVGEQLIQPDINFKYTFTY